MRDIVMRKINESVDGFRRILEDEECLNSIEDAVETIVSSIDSGRKLIICGNGGSAADAQHIAGEFLCRFYHNRRPLPAISLSTDTSVLTSISNDYSYDEVFSRQVRALGKKGDILLGISTSGSSKNVCRAFETASAMGIKTVLLTGVADTANISDIVIQTPSKDTPRIQEMHLLIEHIICEVVERRMMGDKKIVFIDRDGTINEDRGYIHKIDDFVFIPGSLDALRTLTLNEVLVYIVTNQSGIARGYYTEEDFHRLNSHMLEKFKSEGIQIEDVLYCPHHPEGTVEEYSRVCDCRKPSDRFLRDVMEKHGVSKKDAAIIGDKNSDIDAGRSLGIVTYLVETGFGAEHKKVTNASYVVSDLNSAVLNLLENWGMDETNASGRAE